MFHSVRPIVLNGILFPTHVLPEHPGVLVEAAEPECGTEAFDECEEEGLAGPAAFPGGAGVAYEGCRGVLQRSGPALQDAARLVPVECDAPGVVLAERSREGSGDAWFELRQDFAGGPEAAFPCLVPSAVEFLDAGWFHDSKYSKVLPYPSGLLGPAVGSSHAV